MSDICGVSMLVDSINHSNNSNDSKGLTESAVLGPFFGSFPLREYNADIHLTGYESAVPCLYHGNILDHITQKPISSAKIDIWLTDVDGLYSIQGEAERSKELQNNLTGQFISTNEGEYKFRAIIPTSYPIRDDGPVGKMLHLWGRRNQRPAHIHFKVEAIGYETLVTQIYVEGDPCIDEDPVFGVRSSLVYKFPLIDDQNQAKELGLKRSPHSICSFDIKLQRKK
jgi:hydroxyquinol 1,2-dioxygenase